MPDLFGWSLIAIGIATTRVEAVFSMFFLGQKGVQTRLYKKAFPLE